MSAHILLHVLIAIEGQWYAALPFGDPERLRKIEKYMVGQVEEAVARAESAGNEDLPLQEAALRSANVIGTYLLRRDEASTEMKGRLHAARHRFEGAQAAEGESGSCGVGGVYCRLHNDFIAAVVAAA